MPTNTNAADELAKLFASYGLSSLAPKILDYAKQGLSTDETYLKLQDTTEWKVRFAGNETRRKNNLAVLSPAEYLSREAAYQEDMRSYGLPKGFYDHPDDYAKLIGANVGSQELRQRLDARKAVVQDGAATGVLAYAKAQYGLSDGDLIAYFIDPNRAAPLLEKIANASQIGAAAARTGFGAVGRADAERLAALGVSGQQAAAGYSQAAELGGLADTIQGTDTTSVSRADLAKATLEDDADAKRRIQRRQQERAARFSGGGTYAESQGGISGLGSASR